MKRVRHGVVSADFSSQTPSRSGTVVEKSAKTNTTLPMDGKDTDQTVDENDKGPCQRFDLAHSVNRSYSRASKLLREALGASRVAFVDASYNSTNMTPSRSRSSSTPSDINTGSAISDTDVSDGAIASFEPSKMCKVLGISTYMQADDEPTSTLELSQPKLTTLIKAYPRAKVFSFLGSGDDTRAPKQADLGVRVIPHQMQHSRRSKLDTAAMPAY